MRVTLTKGKERVTCICGWQAPTFDKGDEAGVLLYRKHAGLVEKK
jgi:hypothetical protein